VIDYFSIALTHGLIALAALRLLSRDDLDEDLPDAAEAGEDSSNRPWLKSRVGGGDA